jgi:hypothetical protein
MGYAGVVAGAGAGAQVLSRCWSVMIAAWGLVDDFVMGNGFAQ